MSRKSGRGDDEEKEAQITDVNGVPLDDPRLRNLDPILLEKILNEILDKTPAVSWDDIGLLVVV